MRRRQEDLGGPIANTPQANPLESLSTRIAGGARALDAQLLDFSALSQAAYEASRIKKERENEITADFGTRVGELQAKGVTDVEEIISQVTGKNPTGVRKKLADQMRKDGVEGVTSPVFKLHLQTKVAQYKVAQHYRDYRQLHSKEHGLRLADAAEKGDEQKALNDILGEVYDANQEAFKDLGYFGQRAAEEAIFEQNQKYLDEISASSRKHQADAAEMTAGAAYTKIADSLTQLVDDKGKFVATEVEKAKVFMEIAKEYSDSIGAVENPEAMAITRTLAMGHEIRETHGPQVAAEILRELHDNVTVGTGYKLFRQTGEAELLRQADRFQAEYERERDTSGEKKENMMRNAAMAFRENGAVMDRLIDASQEGGQKLSDVAKAMDEEFKADKLPGMAEMDDKHKAFFRSWLLNETQGLRPSANAISDNRKRLVLNQALAMQAAGDHMGAIETITASGLQADDKQHNMQLIRQARDAGVDAFKQRLDQSGVRSDIQKIVTESMGPQYVPDMAEPGEIALFNSRVNALDEMMLDEIFKKATDPTAGGLEDTEMYRREFLERARTRFPSKLLTSGEKPPSTEPDKLEDVLEREKLKATKAEGAFNSMGTFVLGGLGRSRAPASVTRMHDKLVVGGVMAERPVKPEVVGGPSVAGDYGIISAPLTRFRDAAIRIKNDPDLPPQVKADVLAEAVSRQGSLSSWALMMYMQGAEGNALSQAEQDNPGADDDSPTIGETLKELGDLDFSDVDIFSTRLFDYSESNKWLATTVSISATDALKFNESFTPEMRQRTELLLRVSGTAVTEDNLLRFVSMQAKAWGK